MDKEWGHYFSVSVQSINLSVSLSLIRNLKYERNLKCIMLFQEAEEKVVLEVNSSIFMFP